MSFPRPISLVVTILLALAPAGLGAQQGEGSALQKSDLVRVLTGTTYSKAEIASMVRRNCLTFVPTGRDRQDLRELGATQAIFTQIDQCVRKGNRPTAPEPAPPRPIEVVVIDRASSAQSGTVAYITVQLRRGDRPETGRRLVLRGATSIPGGARSNPTAVTDATGQVVFAVPAGTRAGSYELNVAAADGTALQGNGALTLTTLPTGTSVARISPSTISLRRGSPAKQTITVTVADPFSNPIVKQEIELRPSVTRPGLAPQMRQTSDSGTAVFDVTTAALRSGDSLMVTSGQRTLGVVTVSATAEVAAQLVEAARLSATGDPGAEAAYDRALAVDPNNADALLGRATLRSRAGRYDEAEADFQAARRNRESAVAALTGLGYNSARRGDYAAAIGHFQAALEVRPSDDAAATGLVYAELWRSDPHQAARRSEVLNATLIPSYPSTAADQFRTGARQLAERQLAGAERALSSAVAAAPSWPDAYYNRALTYEARGRSDMARADFERYLRLRPSAADRAQIAKHIVALGRSPTGALARGLILPGFGQFYTGRPVLGVAILAGVAGGTVWALQEKRTLETRTFPNPFGGPDDTVQVSVRKRPNMTAGLAAAGGLWLLAALESSIHAGSARGGIPLPLPVRERQRTAGSGGSASAERAMLRPVVSFQPTGPQFGAGITIPFR